MGIRRLRVTNYRGVMSLDEEIPPAGAIVKGRNGSGKSSTIFAIRAALEARDVDASAIRIGAKKAEILVDFDHFTVRRLITQKQSTVTVTTDAGDRKAKPVQWLSDLIGTGLDPLALYLAKPKERRELVLGTMAVKLTAEHVDRWAPKDIAAEMIDADLLEMHGLEALAKLHKRVYDARADVNKRMKDLHAEIDIDKRTLDELRERLPGTPPKSVEDAQRAVDAAVAKVADEKANSRARGERMAHNATTRTRISELHASADANEGHRDVVNAPTSDAIDKARADSREAEERVHKLETALSEARQYATQSRNDLRNLEERLSSATTFRSRASALREQAIELEKMIVDDPVLDVTELGHAEKSHADAVAELDVARTKASFDTARAALSSKRTTLDEVRARADALTAVVDKLRIDAPAELLREAQGIAGLGVDGESITLDGVSIDALSGREQLLFAVRIAKRAASKAKMLVVDGLERLDPEQYDAFVREATAEGWQLLGTRVARGEAIVEKITLDDAEAAAQ
jgi:recombinational DNA repair ATPase RecF